MAMLASETVEKVKDSADIVEIVSAYTDLRRAGQRWSGLCPFHDERTPSFSVDPAEKLYYCFGCGEGGDVFKFLQEKEGLSFPDAVESLAERYGVEIEREQEDPRVEAARRRKARLYEVMQRTAAYYANFLWDSPKAAKARDYLLGRGLSEQALRDYGVGYAPSPYDTILLAGQRAGFTVQEMKGAGLLVDGGRGPYDKFRARIMFPIRDQRGRVIAFGGRATSSDQKAKYMNSAEGELFHKSEVLFGLDLARGAITKAGRAVVVEGYTDVLALHQAGIAETVAVMGTAITPEQLGSLSKLCDEVVLALDADRAGQDAMVRAQKVATGREMRLRVAKMPEGVDPADMLKDGEQDRFEGLLNGAVDLAEFQVETALARGGSSPSEREKTLSAVAPVLKAMGETVGRSELLRRVESALDTEPGLVARRVNAAVIPAETATAAPSRSAEGGGGGEAREPTPDPISQPPEIPPTPRELRERALLAMCIADPSAGKEMLEKLGDELLTSDLSRRTVAWLRDHLSDPMAGLPREDEEMVNLVTQLVMSSKRDPVSREAMELNLLLLEQKALEDKIEAARKSGDWSSVKVLSAERADLVTRIAGVERV